MFIIWSGLGFLVMAVGALAFAVSIAVTQALFGNTPASAGMGLTLAAILATAGNYELATWIARNYEPRIMVDKASGATVTLVPCDTLFFVPVRYWTFVFAFFAACLMIGNATDLFHK